MAHGKTLELRAIKAPEPTWIHRFEAVADKSKPGRLVRVGEWLPYVNPARDLKRNARLRLELRVSA